MQLKLRQGFGRAIRTETDTCVVSILDSRAARGGRYHEAVLEALPKCRMTEDIGEVERFIREKKGIDYYMQEVCGNRHLFLAASLKGDTRERKNNHYLSCLRMWGIP